MRNRSDIRDHSGPAASKLSLNSTATPAGAGAVRRSILVTNAATFDPVDEMDRIRRKLSSLADARREWGLTPRDEHEWDQLTGRERVLLHRLPPAEATRADRARGRQA